MGPTMILRIKTPDVGIPMLHIEYEVMAVKHNYQLSNVIHVVFFQFYLYLVEV